MPNKRKHPKKPNPGIWEKRHNGTSRYAATGRQRGITNRHTTGEAKAAEINGSTFFARQVAQRG